MFIIPCKYNGGNSILECVSSIRYYHDDKIVIVDSNSDNNSYIDRLENKYNNLTVITGLNNNRMPGALKVAYKMFPNENFYTFIHDSVILKKSLDEFINSKSNYTFYHFYEHMTGTNERNRFKELIQNTKYNFIDKRVKCLFGMMFLIKGNIMKKFDSNGLFDSIESNSKFDDQMYERIIGHCLYQENIDIESIEGDFLTEIHLQREKNIIEGNYIKKSLLNRQ